MLTALAAALVLAVAPGQSATVRVPVANVWEAPNAGHLPLDPHAGRRWAQSLRAAGARRAHAHAGALRRDGARARASARRLDEDRSCPTSRARSIPGATRGGCARGSSARRSPRRSSSRCGARCSRTAPRSASGRTFRAGRCRQPRRGSCRTRGPISCGRPNGSSASTTCGAGCQPGATTAPGSRGLFTARTGSHARATLMPSSRRARPSRSRGCSRGSSSSTSIVGVGDVAMHMAAER